MRKSYVDLILADILMLACSFFVLRSSAIGVVGSLMIRYFLGIMFSDVMICSVSVGSVSVSTVSVLPLFSVLPVILVEGSGFALISTFVIIACFFDYIPAIIRNNMLMLAFFIVLSGSSVSVVSGSSWASLMFTTFSASGMHIFLTFCCSNSASDISCHSSSFVMHIFMTFDTVGFFCFSWLSIT